MCPSIVANVARYQARWSATTVRTALSGSAYSAAALMNAQPRKPGRQLAVPICSANERNASASVSVASRTPSRASRSRTAWRSR